MTRGSSTRSGPPPDPNALHRERDKGEWTTLPAEGRKGRVPKLPLSDPTVAEVAMWKEVWKLPQAVMWESQNQHREVALYVRAHLAAAKPDAPATRITAAMRMAESLGISVPGMLRNKWRIGGLEPQAQAPRKTKTSSRERFKVVDGTG